MYRDVRSFVAALDAAGQLARIREAVSPVLDIAAAADRESKQPAPGQPSGSAARSDPRHSGLGGRALLFERVEGSDFPVLINAYGSYRRMEMALGCGPGEGGIEGIARRIAALVEPSPPRGVREALAMARRFAPLLRIGPKRRRGPGACQEVVRTGDGVDLTRIPMLRCWPLDGDLASVGYPADVNAGMDGAGHPDITAGAWDRAFRGRYITLAGVHTIHADDADDPRPRSHNIGMYRLQLVGKRRLAMHWHIHHDGAAHWRSWKRAGRQMPVAIVLGGESVLPYAATAPLPPGISELLMAGFLAGRGVEMVRAQTVPLWVPAGAEIVIEGWVSVEAGEIGYDPRRAGDGPLGPGALFEGPFGDHTGFYSMPDRYPLVEVTAVTHRRSAIYPTTIVGPPPQEDYFLGKTTERLFLPLLRTLVPDIADYDLPMFGAFHNCAMVKIRKAYPLHARKVMHAVWGAGQMAWTKTIFVVDEDCDVHDARAVLRRAAECCDPIRDVEITSGPLDILDHAAPWLGAGGKIGFDCTRKIAGEEMGADAPTRPAAPDDGHRAAVLAAVRRIEGVGRAEMPPECGGWLFIWAAADGQPEGASSFARRVVDAIDGLGGDAWVFVVIVGPDAAAVSTDEALFHWVANFDPGRDLVRGRTCIAFDAAPKAEGPGRDGRPVRAWPPYMRR